MTQVIQAKCPRCRNVLRIPADWVGQSIRCKHCGQVIQSKKKTPPARPAPATPPPLPPRLPKAAAPPVPALAAPEPPPMAAPAPQPTMAEPPMASIPQAAVHASGDPFSQLDDDSGEVLPRRRRRRRSPWKSVIVAASLLGLIIIGGAIGVYAMGGPRSLMARLSGDLSEPTKTDSTARTAPGSHKSTENDLPKLAKVFPRRLLAISVNNYLYANPVAYGQAEQSVDAILKRMGTTLHIPESQIAELSDAAPDAHAPLKPVIESTITDYLDSCRAQDRVFLLFIGHAVAIGNEGYLVPIEGEMKDKETLIPLSWLYDKLAQCKARQKVLIMDVCRFDPSRGVERPGSGPMAAKLDAALQKPPAGVQVWSACVAGQYSYESNLFISNGSSSYGGIFLGELWESVGPFKKRVEMGIQRPEDPLPVMALAQGNENQKGVSRGTTYEAEEDYHLPQTPRLAGTEPADGAAFDPQEPLPEKLVIKMPPPPPGGWASRQLIDNILKEAGVEVIREGATPLNAQSLPLFAADALKPYEKVGPMTPFREAVLNAIALLQKHSKTFSEEFRGAGDNNVIKGQILMKQREPARALAELTDAQAELDKVSDSRSREPKRWQANYDYVRAKIEAKFAYVYEYNFMLGQIRKDAMPARDPNKNPGWRLAAQEKLQSGGEAKKHAADSKKLLQKLAAKCKGTPWEVLAKREELTALGLQWQLIPQQ